MNCFIVIVFLFGIVVVFSVCVFVLLVMILFDSVVIMCMSE